MPTAERASGSRSWRPPTTLVGAAFDFVHARMVPEQVPGRAAALANMLGVIAPGGWLVIEACAAAPSLAHVCGRPWESVVGAPGRLR